MSQFQSPFQDPPLFSYHWLPLEIVKPIEKFLFSCKEEKSIKGLLSSKDFIKISLLPPLKLVSWLFRAYPTNIRCLISKTTEFVITKRLVLHFKVQQLLTWSYERWPGEKLISSIIRSNQNNFLLNLCICCASGGKASLGFASRCTAKQIFIGKSVVLHLLEGPELRMHNWVDIEEKKPSTRWDSNSQSLCYEACTLPLCYNRCPRSNQNID